MDTYLTDDIEVHVIDGQNITVTIFGVFIIHGVCKMEINNTTIEAIREDWSKFVINDIKQYQKLRDKWFK